MLLFTRTARSTRSLRSDNQAIVCVCVCVCRWRVQHTEIVDLVGQGSSITPLLLFLFPRALFVRGSSLLIPKELFLRSISTPLVAWWLGAVQPPPKASLPCRPLRPDLCHRCLSGVPAPYPNLACVDLRALICCLQSRRRPPHERRTAFPNV